MTTFRPTTSLGRLLLKIVAGVLGLACLIVCLAWGGCASPDRQERADPPQPLPDYSSFRSAPARNNRFKDNVLFLSEPHVPVSEVYASFGQPDWQSKQLRLIAYRAVNNQALFVLYGADIQVARYAVRKLKPTDSLEQAATHWLQGQ